MKAKGSKTGAGGAAADRTPVPKLTIDLDTAAKAAALLAVVLPISAVLTRWVAMYSRFGRTSLQLAAGQSLLDLTVQGAAIMAIPLGLATFAYVASRGGTKPSAKPAGRRRKGTLAVEVIILVLLLVWAGWYLAGFPGTIVAILFSTGYGLWLARTVRGALSIRDLVAVIIVSAFVTSVAFGASGLLSPSSGEYSFAPDSGVPDGPYVQVAWTDEHLIYLTPCSGRPRLIAVRFEEVRNVTVRPTIDNPSLGDILGNKGRLSFGYPDRC